MKKIIKRIICIILAVAIAVVSIGSVSYALEIEGPYKTMYQVSYKFNDENVADDVKNTAYNSDITPYNFSAESKDVLGNEKHYLTWDNTGLENSYDYNVEVYCVLYMEYRTIDENNENTDTEMDLENTPWSEYPFIPIQCVTVDASDCGTVVNFSDIQETLKNENLFAHDPENDPDDGYEQVLKLYSFLENKFNLHYFTDKLNDYNRFYYYMSYIPDSMRYLRFGRVKYFARYVSKHSKKQLLQPDADGYYHYYFDFVPMEYNSNYLETKDKYDHVIGRYGVYNPVTIEKYEIVSPERLYLGAEINFNSDYINEEFTRQPNGSYYETLYEMPLRAEYWLCNMNGWISDIKYRGYNIGNPNNSIGARNIYSGKTYKGSTEDEAKALRKIDVSNITNLDQFYVDTNIPVNFQENNNSEISDWINNGVYSYDTVTVGKFIENDTQIINVKPTPSPTPDTSSSPDVIIVPPSSTTTPKPTPTPSRYPGTGDDYTDTNVHDDNTDMSDVVHWLKMIYNRLGKQLEQFKIINTVVDKLDDIISNQKKLIKGFTDSGTDSENYDVVRYLKKIYNLLLVDKFLDTADELYDYVFDYIAQIGEVFVSTAGSVVDTASKTFPFSVVFIPKLVLDAMSAEPVTPYKKINIKLDEKQVGNVTMPGFDFSFVIDLSQFDSVASMFRQMSVIIFLCGMVKHTVDVVILMKEGVV